MNGDLQNHELFTLEDLDAALQGVNEKAGTISAAMKKAEKLSLIHISST